MDKNVFNRRVSELETEYSVKIKPVLKDLNDRSKQFMGLNVIIPFGKYKGRVGKITYVGISEEGKVEGIIQPFMKNTKGEITKVLLWDHVDARTYWPLSEVKEIVKGK